MAEPIGLRRGTVNVVAYQPAWVTAYDKEKQRLQDALGGYISAIEHAGSTAVPGLAAKPIIDMIAAVDDLSVYKEVIRPLTALGYEYMPERVFAGRVFFPKGPRENRTHHLSLVVKNSEGWTQPLLFRDYLRKNNAALNRYQTLKAKLATQYPDDRASYTKAKEQLIQEILNEAAEKPV